MRRDGLKAPKLRFKPGERLTYKGTEYEVQGAFRLRSEPHEWMYRLVDLTPIVQLEAFARLDELAQWCAPSIDVVVYEPFRDSMEAASHFIVIPAKPGRRSDILVLRNAELLRAQRIK